MINNCTLPRVAIPTQWLNEVELRNALLQQMPLTALVRNLGKVSAVGLMKPFRRLGALPNLSAVRRLAREQESLNELAFAPHDEAGEPPKPFLLGNLRFGIQPACQECDLVP